MTWNFDISTAPKGKTITVMRNTKTKDGVVRLPVKEFEPDQVWLATHCGKGIKSSWLVSEKNAGRWAGLATNEQPAAWQHFVTPAHPNLSKPLSVAMTAAAEHLFAADGVGGQ